MRRAVSSFCRIDLPLRQALPLLHDDTTTAIELFCEAPHLDITGDVTEPLHWLRAYARDHGITYTLHAPCFDLNPAAANAGARAEVLRQYRAAITIAQELEASQVVVHSGQRSDPRLSSGAARAWTRGLLETLLPHAERAGVRLALENTGYGAVSIITAPHELLELVADLPPDHLGLTLDIGHIALQQIDLAMAIAAWMPRLCNVHLHDNHGSGDDHLPPGQGRLPLTTALALLEQHGYTGDLVLESFLGGESPVAPAEAWAALEG